MMNNLENIDNYFKDRLEQYEASPPYETWDRIADRLGHNRRRRTVLFITRIAAGLAFLISTSILIYNIQKTNKGDLAVKDKTRSETRSVINTDKSAITEKEPPESRKSLIKQNEIIDKSTHTQSGHDQTINKGSAERASHPERNDEGTTPANQLAVNNIVLTDRTGTENPGYIIPLSCRQIENTVDVQDIKRRAQGKQKTLRLPVMNPDKLPAFKEETGEKKSHQTKWALGGQFAPLYSYRSMSSDFYQDYVKDQINSKESGVIAYAGGINVQMSPGRRLSVQSGIYYSKYGQDKNNLEYAAYQRAGWSYNNDKPDLYDQITPSVFIGNSTGQIVPDPDNSSDNYTSQVINGFNNSEMSAANAVNSPIPVKSVTQYLEYLELPVNLKYKVFDRKLDVSLSGGVSTNFLIGTDVYLNYSDNSRQNTDYVTEGLNRINYSGSLGIGFEYPLSKNFILNIEPKFKYYFNDVATDRNYDIHPYSIGIYTGISFEF